MNGFVVSWIRTAVPVAVGAVLTWLASVTGIALSPESSAGLTATVMAGVIAVYYGLVRLAESRWPGVGLLLGAARQPSYGPAVRRPVKHDGGRRLMDPRDSPNRAFGDGGAGP